MRRGFLYLVAVMDWATRKVLAWRVFNTMDVAFCVKAVREALAQFGRPEILQHRSGQPIHLGRVHRRAEEHPSIEQPCRALSWYFPQVRVAGSRLGYP